MAARLFFFVAVPIVLLWMFVLWLFLPQGSTLSLAIFLIGALIFLWGFKAFRELRILEDIPLIPVRSVSTGLSCLKGKATGEDQLASPLTDQPCYYYRVHVGKLDEKRNDGPAWCSYKAKTETRRFHLDDRTGRALVDPQSAELDVEYTFHAEIGPHSKYTRYVNPSLGAPGLAEAELRTLVAANPRLTTGLRQSNDGPLVTPADLSPAMAARIDPRESYRFTEHCLLAGR